MSVGNSIDFGVIIVEFIELNGHGIVLVNELKAQPNFFVRDLDGVAAQFFHEKSKLIQSQTAFLFVKIVEDFPESQLVSSDDLMEFGKTVLDLGTGFRRNAVEGFSLLALEGGHGLELPI